MDRERRHSAAGHGEWPARPSFPAKNLIKPLTSARLFTNRVKLNGAIRLIVPAQADTRTTGDISE
jgi:hypothetical protein